MLLQLTFQNMIEAPKKIYLSNNQTNFLISKNN